MLSGLRSHEGRPWGVPGEWLRRALPPVAPLSRRARWALAGILVASLAARVGWAVGYAGSPIGNLTDPVLYGLLGDQIAHGHGFTYPGEDAGPTAYYPPGYPLALGVVLWLVGLLPGDFTVFGVAVVFNIVLSVATVAMVFELGRRLVGVPVGLVAAAVMALWPNLVLHSGLVLTETLFLFFFTAMLLVAVATPAVARAPGWRRVVVTGLLCGAAGMVRPTSFVIVPVLLWLWWPAGSRLALRRFVVACGAVALLVLPWTVRNTLRMDAPVLISTNLGDNLCIGNNPEATGGYQLPDSCFGGLHGGDRPEAETERQSKTFRTAWDYIRDHPGEFVGKMPAKLGYTLYRDTDGLWTATSFGAKPFVSADRFQQFKWVSTAYYRIVLLAAVAGLALMWWRARRGSGGNRGWDFLVLTALVQLVPAMITFGDPRFKMPLYPAMAIGAAVAVYRLGRIGASRPVPPVDEGEADDEPDVEVAVSSFSS